MMAGMNEAPREYRQATDKPRSSSQNVMAYPTLQPGQYGNSWNFSWSTGAQVAVYQNPDARPATKPTWFMTTYLPRCLGGATSLRRSVCAESTPPKCYARLLD